MSTALLLAGCRHPARETESLQEVQRSQPLLGTFVTITAYGGDRAVLHEDISAAFSEIRRIDQLLSIHREGTELALVNARATEAPVPASPELYELLLRAREISEMTEGAFDLTIGPLAQLWGFIWKEHRLPTPEELAGVLPLVGREQLQLTNGTVRFLRSGMFLDPGGIGKGYAVDRAIETLRTRNVRSAMVKAGGDLRVIGLPPGADSWAVQIEDPQKEGSRRTIQIREGALSTSGNYENYFEVDGVRYSHILNPRTGLPVQGIASCTVTASTCLESDALATAFFVLGVERSLDLFGHDYGIRFIWAPSGSTSLKVTESESFPAP